MFASRTELDVDLTSIRDNLFERGVDVSPEKWIERVEDSHEDSRKLLGGQFCEYDIDIPAPRFIIDWLYENSVQFYACIKHITQLLRKHNAESIFNWSGINTPWLITRRIETEDGEQKVGKFLRKKIDKVDNDWSINPSINQILNITAVTKFAHSHYKIRITTNPQNFLDLGEHSCDECSCFRRYGERCVDPAIIGQSHDSVIIYLINPKESGEYIKGRAWGYLGQNGLIYTNKYTLNDSIEAKILMDYCLHQVSNTIFDSGVTLANIISPFYGDIDYIYLNGDEICYRNNLSDNPPEMEIEHRDIEPKSRCDICEDRYDPDDINIDINDNNVCCHCQERLYTVIDYDLVPLDETVIDYAGNRIREVDAVNLYDGGLAAEDDPNLRRSIHGNLFILEE